MHSKFSLVIYFLFSWGLLTPVWGEIIDCTVPKLANIVDPVVRSQMNGNRKEGSLRSCLIELSDLNPLIKFHVFGRSKDQSVVRVGPSKITKTHYNVAFDLFLDFTFDQETCQPALVRDDIKFHSEGIFVSHIVRGILEGGRSEIRQKIREMIHQKIREKEDEFAKLCSSN